MKRTILYTALFLLISIGSVAQSINDKIDPETKVGLDGFLKAIPGGFNSIRDIVKRRAFLDQMLAGSTPVNTDIIIKEYKIPGLNNAPKIALRVYTPKNSKDLNPAIYNIHGGGMIIGSAALDDGLATTFALKFNAVVVSVDYRLAPENPYPAAVEDCYAGIVWVEKNAKILKIDTDRLIVYGGSAGGGLTIATSLMARDHNNYPKIAFQMALYPMIDDRNATVSSQQVTNVGIWDRSPNIEAWNWYLGGKSADGYAAPARAKSLKGLPPTFIDVGEVDVFRDEDIEFAKRLLEAGVTTEFHVHPGAFHASEIFVPTAELSKRIWEIRYSALDRAMKK